MVVYLVEEDVIITVNQLKHIKQYLNPTEMWGFLIFLPTFVLWTYHIK